jgi:hypothetical protein
MIKPARIPTMGIAIALLLLLAGVIVAADAQGNESPAHGNHIKNKGKGKSASCKPEFPQCQTCKRDSDGNKYCTKCPGSNQSPSNDCECTGGQGFISKSAWAKCTRGKGKHNGNGSTYPGCIDCAECNLGEDNGQCTGEITLTVGRRLFEAEEDLWV